MEYNFCHLPWSNHLTNRFKIAFDRYISIRRCIPKCVPAFTKLKLYKLYILPIVLYVSQNWYTNITTILEKLEIFQNRILKWAFPTPSSNYKDRLIKEILFPFLFIYNILMSFYLINYSVQRLDNISDARCFVGLSLPLG